MNNINKASNSPQNVLSRETLDILQNRLEAIQPMKIPKSALNEIHNNITNRETIIVLLGEQIITTHNLIIILALRAGIEVKNDFNNRLPAASATAKLINAFTRQIELLENLKAPEMQKINIANMNISDNGQAFVGNYSKS